VQRKEEERGRREERSQREEERGQLEQRKEEERRREEQEREEQIEALLQRGAFSETVDYMNGTEFENFTANVFAKKGSPYSKLPSLVTREWTSCSP
jgi:negative regulator of genetic competence, sporulation and motility